MRIIRKYWLLEAALLLAFCATLACADEIRLRIETVNGQPKIVVFQPRTNHTGQTSANIDLVLERGLVLTNIGPNLWMVRREK